MRKYGCMWRGKETTVMANTSYEAQQKAQKYFGAKKGWEITVLLLDDDGLADAGVLF